MTPIRSGEAVRVRGGEKDGRPGVVLRVMDQGTRVLVFVPWGTGTLREEMKRVEVRPRTAAGTALRVEKPTYFYARNVTRCDTASVERLGVLCPPSLLVELQALFGM